MLLFWTFLFYGLVEFERLHRFQIIKVDLFQGKVTHPTAGEVLHPGPGITIHDLILLNFDFLIKILKTISGSQYRFQIVSVDLEGF